MLFPGKRPVRVGDKTTHGGTVMPASHSVQMGDRQVVVVGDAVMCPRCGITTIVEGDPTWRLRGAHIALHGHRTSCGAILIASLPA